MGSAVRAHGVWLYTPGEYHGPEGHARYLAPAFYPLPGVPGGVLLARIGEVGQPLVVGQAESFVADSLGELAFRIDDDFLADNVGLTFCGVLLGAQEFKASRSRSAMVGFMTGEMALGLIVIYSLLFLGR